MAQKKQILLKRIIADFRIAVVLLHIINNSWEDSRKLLMSLIVFFVSSVYIHTLTHKNSQADSSAMPRRLEVKHATNICRINSKIFRIKKKKST